MPTPSEIHQIKGFIKFFAAIPEEQWTVRTYGDWHPDGAKMRHCALGHLGAMDTGVVPGTEAFYLHNLVLRLAGCSIASVNDGLWHAFPQPTPKARVLTALRSLLS